MRLALGELAPVPAEPLRNVARLAACVAAARADLAVFPELFLSGYRVGDRVHRLALAAGGDDPVTVELKRVAATTGTPIVVGAPVGSAARAGEVTNAAVVIRPDGAVAIQAKRYLPNFGPFEEGLAFSPTDASRPVAAAGRALGVEICYDVFFPEVARDLALAGAELLINISASPVTSRALFDRLLPARAIENGGPVVYVNRVGVEDGVVFGGGSGAWDPRGEAIAAAPVAVPGLAAEERLAVVELDLDQPRRWRPMRPVLRDVAARPAPPGR
ncbi:MAG TPA: carbon-nitrogen hydrolase family protein [Thermoplasmata archaeon]|nr:carbon-nitrogen hydrolase family protein [Thermoplasmata archaeon]